MSALPNETDRRMNVPSAEIESAILKGNGAMVTQSDLNVVISRITSNHIIIGRISRNDQVASANIMLYDCGIEHA